jgi:hypothetical protein
MKAMLALLVAGSIPRAGCLADGGVVGPEAMAEILVEAERLEFLTPELRVAAENLRADTAFIGNVRGMNIQSWRLPLLNIPAVCLALVSLASIRPKRSIVVTLWPMR